MNRESNKRVIYVDYLDNEFKNRDDADRSNKEIELKFRKYIENNLLSTFSDGCIDKLKTTNNIFSNLDFTKVCISNIIKMIDSNNECVKAD